MKISLKVLSEGMSKYPLELATVGSAAFDMRYAGKDTITLRPGESVLFPSGIAIHIGDANYCGLLLSRSGLGCKGLVVSQGVGLIDSDYQQEIMIPLTNRSEEVFTIRQYDRIAQMIIQRIERPMFVKVEEFSLVSNRGGFGSTGTE